MNRDALQIQSQRQPLALQEFETEVEMVWQPLDPGGGPLS